MGSHQREAKSSKKWHVLNLACFAVQVENGLEEPRSSATSELPARVGRMRNPSPQRGPPPAEEPRQVGQFNSSFKFGGGKWWPAKFKTGQILSDADTGLLPCSRGDGNACVNRNRGLKKKAYLRAVNYR